MCAHFGIHQDQAHSADTPADTQHEGAEEFTFIQSGTTIIPGAATGQGEPLSSDEDDLDEDMPDGLVTKKPVSCP